MSIDSPDTTTESPDTTTHPEPIDIDVSNPASFNVEMSFEVPDVIQEDTIRDNQTLSDLPDDTQHPMKFTLIDFGTKRGKNKLADSLGYTYTVKRR